MNINKNDIKIISVEETTDYEYGKSIVKYSISGKNFISYIFSSQQYNDYDENIVKQEILDFIELNHGLESYPSWSELSEILRNLIMDSAFDMRFVEYDEEEWNEEKAQEILNEADKWHSFENVIEQGEDCYITIFASAMCCVNWYEM